MIFQNDITSCILGSKNCGKSVMLASFLNESKQGGILLDMLGIYNPKNSYKTAVVPNSYYCLGVDNYIDNFDKFPADAKIIIDFSEYYGEEAIKAADVLCNHLLKNKKAGLFMSDEIADIMPQQGNGSKALHQLIKNGRNFGIKPIIFATQRPQSVNKSIFDLCDNFYISTQRAPRTVDYILDIIDASGNKEMKQEIAQLPARTFLKYDGGEIINYKVPEYKYAFMQ